MSSNDHTLFIKPTIAKVYIVFGILFMSVFLLGAFVLEDWTNLVFCASSSLIVYIGFSALKNPSASYNSKELIVYSLFGKIRFKYNYQSTDQVKIKNNLLYLDSKKLKLNHWFIQQEDWRRMMQFFSGDNEDILNELKES